MDATGAYAVRALALGGGSIETMTKLNDHLRRVDWQSLEAQEGLSRLQNLVAEAMKESGLQTQCAVECAIVDTQSRKLVRKFLQDHQMADQVGQ